MTEREWLDSRDPKEMLQWVHGHTTERKLRLFACAVARRLPPHGDPQRGERRAAVIVLSERLLEGEKVRGLKSARNERWVVAASDPLEAALGVGDEKLKDCQPELADLVRCVFGVPHRKIGIDRTRLTNDVLAMATPAYDERVPPRMLLDSARLGILADALDDIGCDERVLEHLRSPGPHVRGCWALDLVLGRA